MNPLHASFYADTAVQRTSRILENVCLARDTYRVRVDCADIAATILPGQFVMLRLANCDDPLIGRPLALYDTAEHESGTARAVDVVYLVKGKFTTRLARCGAGDRLDIWGPLGNGFVPRGREHLIMVAGGIGQTPFLAVAREALALRTYGHPPRTTEAAASVTLCYGARSADLLAGVEDFQRIGVDVRIATDDGSRGHHGFVTGLLEQLLSKSQSNRRIVCCGPEPMMAAVAQIASRTRTPCEVSLETPMACGVGICFTCVAKVRDADGNWDYKRTCVDGPVFESERIDWS